MLRRLSTATFATVLAVSSALVAQDAVRPDVSETSLLAAIEKAKAEYRSAIREADRAFLAAFDAEEKRVKADTQLGIEAKIAGVERIQAERNAFQSGREMPHSPGLKDAGGQYQDKVARARVKCGAVFDALAEKYLQDDFGKAKAVVAQKKRFFREEAAGPPPRRSLDVADGFGEPKFGQGEEDVQGIKIKVGNPQFTLIWDTKADLDLHVVEPGGSEIYWENRKGRDAGVLDVDDVDGFGPENILFDTAPKGKYKWFVHYYGGLGGINMPTSWKLRVKHDGKVTVHKGTLDQIGQRSEVYELSIE